MKRGPSRLAIASVVSLGLLASLLLVHARPSRYGHSDREERHMFPGVSTGPLGPAWSPDGRWIAFSMRGDIWKVPAEGGEAIALTSGPAYHFEPAWSPGGREIALSYDRDGNLDVGIVSAAGGDVRTVASHPSVDLQPAWSPDGQRLFFVSAREDGWHIFAYDLTSEVDAAVSVVAGMQPSVSPDGTELAYASNRGLSVVDLASGESRLVREEETAYRTKPAWTADGQALLYVSDEEGSNDVRVVSANGGRPIRLTIDDDHHELSPTPSPDGTRFAFVSNHEGPTTLYTLDIGGGRRDAWRSVPIAGRQAASPTGRIRVRVLGPGDEPMPARVYIDASDGRSYSPDHGFHRAMMVFDRHYFHTAGDDEVEVPAGETTVEALRGFEYRPAAVTVDVAPGEVRTATIQLERLVDMADRGWYSGDTHLHDLHQGRYGLSHEDFFLQVLAEDIRVALPLIHMDGTRLMGRWDDLTGEAHPLSTSDHILQYAQEFRGGLGHIAMLGVSEFTLPLVAGAGGTAYAQHMLDLQYIDAAREQGGVGGFVHPYLSTPEEPGQAASTLIALDIALGRGDYYDIAALWSDELGSADFYYRLLNAGFHLPVTGGTDNFSDVWRDPPAGSGRTYVHLDEPLSVPTWLEGVKRGRTFATTGPMLFLEVDDHLPGDEIQLAADAPTQLRVRAEARSITPLDSLQILVNGDVAHTVRARDSLHIEYDGPVDVPRGGWIAARVLGPPSPYIGDDYAFGHTSPVYIVRDGLTFRAAADIQFLAETVDATWARADRTGNWRSDAEREAFLNAVEEARAVYRALLGEAVN